MTDTNYTPAAPVLNPATGLPIPQHFLDDPELYALAVEFDCLDMSAEEVDAMYEAVTFEMWLDRDRLSAEARAEVEELRTLYTERYELKNRAAAFQTVGGIVGGICAIPPDQKKKG